MRWIISGALGAVLFAGVASAQDPSLDQRLKVIERRLEIQAEESQARARESAAAVAGEKGFSLKSADGTYELKIRALAHLDNRFFITDDSNPAAASSTLQANDGFLIRRLRPSFEGSAGKLVGFRFTPEFAGDGAGLAASIVDAYVDLKFDPAASLRVGKQKGPVGLERLQSGSAIAFVERGLPTELVPNRDIGAALFGEILGGTTSYVVGVFNGAADGRDAATIDADSRETEGRLFFEPFRNRPGILQGLGFGVGGSYGKKASAISNTGVVAGVGNSTNSSNANAVLPRYRTSGQNQFFSYRVTSTGPATSADTVTADGQHLRWAPQAYWYWGPVGLLGEFVSSEQDVSFEGVTQEFQHQAYQAVLSAALTGEDASFRGITRPKSPWIVGGDGWGALEVVARHGELDVDDGVFDVVVTTSPANPNTSASRARSYGGGLNWILTSNVKLAFDFDETKFLGGAAGGANRPKEQVVFTRLQLTY